MEKNLKKNIYAYICVFLCIYNQIILLYTGNLTDQLSSVIQSCPTLWPHGLQHTRLPCPSPTLEAYSNSCPSSWWCHPTISSSVVPYFSCLQSFPASGSFQMSQRWPKYWSFSSSISPSNEYSKQISFRIHSMWKMNYFLKNCKSTALNWMCLRKNEYVET